MSTRRTAIDLARAEGWGDDEIMACIWNFVEGKGLAQELSESLGADSGDDSVEVIVRVTEDQQDQADAVQGVVGGTLFYGANGTIMLISPDGRHAVSMDPEGDTQSAELGAWNAGYDA